MGMQAIQATHDRTSGVGFQVFSSVVVPGSSHWRSELMPAPPLRKRRAKRARGNGRAVQVRFARRCTASVASDLSRLGSAVRAALRVSEREERSGRRGGVGIRRNAGSAAGDGRRGAAGGHANTLPKEGNRRHVYNMQPKTVAERTTPRTPPGKGSNINEEESPTQGGPKPGRQGSGKGHHRSECRA